MIVGINGGPGSPRYAGVDGDWYSIRDRVSQEKVRYVYFGTGHEFPRNSRSTLADIELALGELMELGGARPTCVAWQADR
jgi:hypothetical protein